MLICNCCQLIRKIILHTFILLGLSGIAYNGMAAQGNNTRADVEWYTIAKNVYQFRYEHHYTMFVVTSQGVVAFDPLSDEAAEYYSHAIKTAAPGVPMRAIIYSHWHTDHAEGAGILRREFGKDVPIIAHERTLARLKKLDNPSVPLPTETVDDRGRTLDFGDTHIELRYIGYGHTDTMLVARIPQQDLVYTVDFANHDSVGWRDLPGWPLDELLAMQKRLLKMSFSRVAFGHGRAGPGDKETIKRQITYYQDLLHVARQSIKEGLTEDQAVKRAVLSLPQYRGWGNYAIWFRSNMRGAYRWIQQHESVKPS